MGRDMKIIINATTEELREIINMLLRKAHQASASGNAKDFFAISGLIGFATNELLSREDF